MQRNLGLAIQKCACRLVKGSKRESFYLAIARELIPQRLDQRGTVEYIVDPDMKHPSMAQCVIRSESLDRIDFEAFGD